MLRKNHKLDQSSRAGRRRRRMGSKREGGAAIEAALIFPLIIIVMMGTLEVCSGIYLKESLTVCAFEGVRVGVRRRGTADMVRDRVEAVLDERQINYSSSDITITPSDFSDLEALDPITVQIVVPTANNTAFSFGHLTGRNVAASVTMVREFDE